jgi:hypothetical protein
LPSHHSPADHAQPFWHDPELSARASERCGTGTPSRLLSPIEDNPLVGLDLAEALEASGLYNLTRKRYLRRLSTNSIDVALESWGVGQADANLTPFYLSYRLWEYIMGIVEVRWKRSDGG